MNTFFVYLLLVILFIIEIFILEFDAIIVVFKENINMLIKYTEFLSNIFTLVIGTLGLLLGFYYYRSRIRFDKQSIEKEKKRYRLQELLEYINSYDLFVDDFLCFNFSDQNRLDLIRDKIGRSFEHIELSIDLNDKFFEFSDEEINSLVKFHSFVDSNELIMRKKYDELKLKTKDLQILKPEYVRLIQKARYVCLNNMV